MAAMAGPASQYEEKAAVKAVAVVAQLDRLEQEAMRLRETVGLLEGRLGMILEPETPEPMVGPPPADIREEAWRVSDRIQQATFLIERVRYQLETLTRRLEV